MDQCKSKGNILEINVKNITNQFVAFTPINASCSQIASYLVYCTKCFVLKEGYDAVI